MRKIRFEPTLRGWQHAAREALAENLSPDEAYWEDCHADQPSLHLFDENEGSPAPRESSRRRVPRLFLESASRVACHRAPERWELLYTLLYRLTHGEPDLLEITTDPNVYELFRMDKAVRHDVHKMRAFVRFREVENETGPWHVAWFEPEHHIVELNAPFFVDRFASMRWSILTPDLCAHWDLTRLTFSPGASRLGPGTNDSTETLWRTYYAHIFNPARVKVRAMQAEMPKRYWKNLPEAALIPTLIHEAPARVQAMIAKSAARQPDDDDEWHPARVPATSDLRKVREAACKCTACPLYKHATQTVFGEGPRNSEIVFVGEQPGDQEDLEGKPFVGPAGQLLNRALEEAGIDRDTVYVTNAVKHFKWEPRGKRRLHKTPNSRDIAACRPWLEAELGLIKPKVLACLGATAAKTILGPTARVTRDRGRIVQTPFCAQTVLTVHPSSLLRAPDEESRRVNYALFIRDLRTIAKAARRAVD
jgi:DNA polymerase